jgi:hypothetical protein
MSNQHEPAPDELRDAYINDADAANSDETDPVDKKLISALEARGFSAEDTGGGCQWMRKPLSDGLSLVVTDGEAGLPETVARLYLMTERHGDMLAQSDLMTTDQMTDHIAEALEVTP